MLLLTTAVPLFFFVILSIFVAYVALSNSIACVARGSKRGALSIAQNSFCVALPTCVALSTFDTVFPSVFE